MDFDWSDPPFNPKDSPTIREIEESFEDPLGIRLFPDSPRFAKESRAFCLGRTLTGRGIFNVYRSFEDPLGIRLFPDSPRFAKESRAFCLGRTLTGRGIFNVY